MKFLRQPGQRADLVDRGRYGEYRRLRFSRLIRPITANGPARDTLRFNGPGTATAVLPDHIYSGGWSHFEERFSLDTRFLLASDGLTGCFPDPAGLWRWLHIHEERLGNPQQQAQLLHDLHAERHARCGDDDISFVWIRPHENSDPTDDRQEERDAG